MSRNILQLTIDNLYGLEDYQGMAKTKFIAMPPPGQHPLVDQIRLILVDTINEMNKDLTIPEIAEKCGMGPDWVAAFKTHRRCVKDFPMNTFFKLTDGLKMDRPRMVKGAEDILASKINKSLTGPYRQLFQKFIECLSDADPNQIELLENTVNTIHRQLNEVDPSQKQEA